MSQVFSYQRLVEFADTDAAGIAHFSSIIQYMESAEHAFLRSLDLSVMASATRKGLDEQASANASNLSWPRVKVDVEFSGVAYFEDRLQIDVSILKLGRSSIQYQFKVLLLGATSDSSTLAIGHVTSVCCHLAHGKTLKSVEIPAYLRAKFSEYVVAT